MPRGYSNQCHKIVLEKKAKSTKTKLKEPKQYNGREKHALAVESADRIKALVGCHMWILPRNRTHT
jgi:hypothetical protein